MAHLKEIFENSITVLHSVIMLAGGTGNTLFVKYQDMIAVKGFNDQPPRTYEHPMIQTLWMFVGMACCLLFYYPQDLIFFLYKTIKKFIMKNLKKKQDSDSEEPIIEKEEDEKKKKEEKPLAPLWLFMAPAAFDLLATELTFIALLNIQPSIHQMLRGSLVIFSSIISIIFLKSRRTYHHWLGVLIVVCGASLVGASSMLYKSSGVARNPVLGIILILCAQFVQSLQLVAEEKLLSGFKVIPLQCAGWEGIWGTLFCFIIEFIIYWIPGKDYGRIEDFPTGIFQTFIDFRIFISSAWIIVGCCMLNYSGITLTQRINNTARAMIDNCRTIFIWGISFALGWESFKWLQMCGFFVLMVGTLTFNSVIPIPYYTTWFINSTKPKPKPTNNDEKNNEKENFVDDNNDNENDNNDDKDDNEKKNLLNGEQQNDLSINSEKKD